MTPVDPHPMEVPPRHPESPPSYRELAGLNDAKHPIVGGRGGGFVGKMEGVEEEKAGRGVESEKDGRGFAMEVHVPPSSSSSSYPSSPEDGGGNAPPSYEDALRSPANALEPSGRMLDEGGFVVLPPLPPCRRGRRDTFFF